MLLSRGRREKVGLFLIPDGPLRGHNKNYESKIYSIEPYLYRKYIIIAMIIQVGFFVFRFFVFFKQQHFLSQVIKQFTELQITMSISNLSAVLCQKHKRMCAREATGLGSVALELSQGCLNATNSSPALTHCP